MRSEGTPMSPNHDPKRVIVLGAGASMADGAPSQADLFKSYFEFYQQQRGTNLIHDVIDTEFRTYFNLVWGVDIDLPLDNQKFPTFEEALGLLELAHAKNEFFKGFGGLMAEATRGQEIRAHLVHLIAIILRDKLRTANRHHRKLVEQLQEKGLLADTDFINLNYDILMDNALQDSSGSPTDYAVRFRNNSDGQTRNNRNLLLKLHGSLNWMYCPTCNQLDFYPGKKIVAQLRDMPSLYTCDVCTEPRVPVIIPPTFFKTMTNFYLQQIWKRAEEVLMRADHIIFCGYSFPDADLHFKYLLKRAEINRREDAPKPEIFIVNEHRCKTEQERIDEKDRYLRFFQNKRAVHWTKLSFADFAANPERYAESDSWS